MEKVEKIDVVGQDWHIEIHKDDEDAMVMRFANNSFSSTPFDEKKRRVIKEDIKDWGKWRKFKELKKDLGD